MGTVDESKWNNNRFLCLSRDDSEYFVGTSMFAATAGACLSLERCEFAQELERISTCEEQKTQRVPERQRNLSLDESIRQMYNLNQLKRRELVLQAESKVGP